MLIRRRALLLLATAWCPLAHAQVPTPASCSPEFQARARELTQKVLSEFHTHGVAVGFFDNGKTCVLTAGSKGGVSGPLTGETLFAMQSMQKTFAATLLALQLEDGKARIDDPAARYLVAANSQRIAPGAPFARVTLRNLVTHTASLPGEVPRLRPKIGYAMWHGQPMAPQVVQFLNGWRPPYPPGTRYAYSNLSHDLAGYAASALGRGGINALLERDVLGPIGMAHTSRAACDWPGPNCAGGFNDSGKALSSSIVAGLWTNVDDLLRYIQAQLGLLRLPDRLARAIARSHRELFRAKPQFAMGMAWELHGQGRALTVAKGGGGAGFTSWVEFQPAERRGLCVLANGKGAGRLAHQLHAQLYGQTVAPPPEAEPDNDADNESEP